MNLTQNTILITGGASGIGLELVKQLTAQGNTVIITGRDQTKLDKAKKLFPKLHTIKSDVSRPEAISALFDQVTKEFPNLNILINNAGVMRELNVHDEKISIEDFTSEIDTNLIAGMLSHTLEQGFDLRLSQCHGQTAVLEAVAVKNVCKTGCQDGAKAVVVQGPDRMFTA